MYATATAKTLEGAKHRRQSLINVITDTEEDDRKRWARENEINNTKISNHNAALSGTFIISLKTLQRFIRSGGHGVCHS